MLLPFSLILLVIDAAAATNPFGRVHDVVSRHTTSFARDLRITFGAILQSRDVPSVDNTRVVYCRSNAGTNDNTGKTGGGEDKPRDSGRPSNGTGGSTRTRSSSSRPAPTGVSTPWSLRESHEGEDFFEGFTFWDLPDPTHGTVDYVDEGTARANGLLSINDDGHAIMRVETTPQVGQNRKSVRIHSKSVWNGGLFIFDVIHAPTGCAVWNAAWTNGPNWPQGGEIDIIEGVGDYTNNQATLHTAPGCRLPSTSPSELGVKGSILSGNCAVADTSNQGCGTRSPSSASFGAGLNRIGGGVYAMKWDEDGIAVYFFPRGDIPDDIEASTPQPNTWGRPDARWPASTCDPFKFFYDNIVIINTTLCGDWQSGVWAASGIPGQEQSCAERTGFATCEQFVRERGESFKEAYWEIRSVKVYTKK